MMLFGLPDKVIKKIHSVFAQHTAVKRVIIYGSRVKGNYKPGSDIDLCIEDSDVTITLLLKIEIQLDDLLQPWKIDLSSKHQIDNQTLLDHINEVGVVFYEKNSENAATQ